jgi:hypothetical protein
MRASLAVLCTALLAFTAAPRTQNSQITIQSKIEVSEVQGAVVTGSMELTLVNAMDATLGKVRLALAAPMIGALGEGILDLGTVDLDATVVRTVDFQLDKASFDSGEPIPITLTYEDYAGERHELNLAARRQAMGGGL